MSLFLLSCHWSYSDYWRLAWVSLLSSTKGLLLLWIGHQLLLPLIDKQAPGLGESKTEDGGQCWVGDGTGQPWEIGGRNLEPRSLGMLSEKVSAEGNWVRPRPRWVGVSKKGDGVLRELECWARNRDWLQPLQSNSKSWVRMIPLLIRPAEKMEVAHMLCHKTEPVAQYVMFPYSGL